MYTKIDCKSITPHVQKTFDSILRVVYKDRMQLAQYMEKLDLTVKEVATAIGCSHASVVRYRQGKQHPGRLMMIKIRRYTAGHVTLNDWDEAD